MENIKIEVDIHAIKLEKNDDGHIDKSDYDNPFLQECKMKEENLNLEKYATIPFYKCNNCEYESYNEEEMKHHTDIKCSYSQMNHSEAELNVTENVVFQPKYKCKDCDFETENEENIRKHILIHLTATCDLCDYNAVFQGDLLKHKRDIHDINAWNIRCHDCSFKTDVYSDLRNHLNTHKMYRCKKCPYTNKTKYKYDQHLRTHLNREEREKACFKCDKCSFKSIYNSSYYKHIQTHKPMSERRKLQCKYCDFESVSSRNSLKRHIRRKHKGEDLNVEYIAVEGGQEKIKCKYCEYDTYCKSHLKLHMRRKHQEQQSESIEPEFINIKKEIEVLAESRPCDKLSGDKTIDDIKKEVITYNKEGNYNNSNEMPDHKNDFNLKRKHVENKKIHHHAENKTRHSDREALKNKRKNLPSRKTMKPRDAKKNEGKFLVLPADCNHSTKNSSEKKEIYQCKRCLFQTNNRRSILKHVRNHSVLLISCTECSYQTTMRNNFLSHKQTHDNKDKYQCSECSYTTSKFSYLKQHVLLHRNADEIKMHKCDQCSYQHQLLKKVNLHKKIHLKAHEARQFECYSCGLKTIHKTSLIKHIRSMHVMGDNGSTKCEHCSFESKNKYKLVMHKLTHLKA